MSISTFITYSENFHKTTETLRNMEYKVEIDPAIAERARASVERMLEIGR